MLYHVRVCAVRFTLLWIWLKLDFNYFSTSNLNKSLVLLCLHKTNVWFSSFKSSLPICAVRRSALVLYIIVFFYGDSLFPSEFASLTSERRSSLLGLFILTKPCIRFLNHSSTHFSSWTSMASLKKNQIYFSLSPSLSLSLCLHSTVSLHTPDKQQHLLFYVNNQGRI